MSCVNAGKGLSYSSCAAKLVGFVMPEYPKFSSVTHEGPHPISGCALAILGQAVQAEVRWLKLIRAKGAAAGKGIPAWM